MSAAAAKNVEATTLRAGIVGAGVFGGYHAQKYDALGGVALTSIFDTDIGRAKALADRFGATFYTDYSLFLKSVDLVSITSPATTHFDMARAAISGGKHCLVEKPIALEATHATALIEQATQADVCLQVGHQERFVANAAKLFKDAENVDDVAWRRCGVGTGRCEDVSVVFDLMIHDLDLARQFDFGEPLSIHAAGDENEVSAVLNFVNGRRFEFFASRRASIQDRSMAVKCGDQSMRYDFAVKNRKIADPLMTSVESFVASVRNNEPTAISGEDGLRALEWACAIEEAWRASAAIMEEAVA
ncbi:MAG: Gfo/Idh/MocA family oxidoreductase [Pseudomonadota bacterium]